MIRKSRKLDDVCYDIRGPVLAEANRMEEEGHRICKLNIGNPTPWGLLAPEEIITDVIRQLPGSQGYCESKGLFTARKAVMQYCQEIGIGGVDVDHVWIGNGVSELVLMATQCLLDAGDEILIPAPDFPLWTAAASLAGGRAVHYRCDEQAGWNPDLDDIRRLISPRTRAIVIINPNNPTGAVYDRAVLLEIVELARRHDLVVLADEIYDKILYDGATHVPIASLADDVLFLTFNGLSKTYRIAGFRVGWMIASGAVHRARDFIEGLDILASTRLCANVPVQHAVQTALGGYQSINDLVRPGGRLHEQRLQAWQQINAIDGLSCVLPRGALYMFVRVDPRRIRIDDDERMALDLLRQEKVLVVQGTAFNWPERDHFRVVFLPPRDELAQAIQRIGHFFAGYSQ